jgi:hypothetical protein
VRVAATVVIAFVAAAVAGSWPLIRHLSTHLTGTTGSDAGVYLWNTWVFRHELVDRGSWPLATDTILPLDGPTPLGLHNYTLVADVMSALLQPVIGLVAAFNVIYLANIALAGLGMFVLARHVLKTSGGGTAEAFWAGLLFCWSPFLIARGTVHFSLVAAAPLPFFVFFLDRALERRRTLDAVCCGGSFAWATFSDPYYGIYCTILACGLVAHRQAGVVLRGPAPALRRVTLGLDIALALVIAVTVAIRLLAGDALQIGPLNISMRTLHTPILAMTILAVARFVLTVRPRVYLRPGARAGDVVNVGARAGLVAAVLLSPILIEVATMAAGGSLVGAPVPWRSSAPGLDALSFILPNPMHPAAPRALTGWLDGQPGGWEENVATLPFVGLVTLGLAWRFAGHQPRGPWLGVTLAFAVLALGPFLRIANMPTQVPLPWALLRYVPLIGEARMPQRFAVVVMLGFAVLFAQALAALGRRYPAHRRAILAAVGLGLVLELLPAPRTLHAVRVPAIYQIIAADPRPVRVLELPFGISDGLVSIGNFRAAALVHQTVHQKPVIGGYLSRIPPDSRRFHLANPLLSALADLSEERVLPADRLATARAAASGFVRYADLGYVVVDTSRTSAALHEFAIDALNLTRVSTSEQYVLYQPGGGP